MAGRKKRYASRRFAHLWDGWSVPHFFFGVVTALGGQTLGWNQWPVFWGTLILALLWEVFEDRAGINEWPENRLADVVLPLLAFLVSWQLVPAERAGETTLALFVVSLLVFGYFNWMAWHARVHREETFLH